jgi:hypothetical protein
VGWRWQRLRHPFRAQSEWLASITSSASRHRRAGVVTGIGEISPGLDQSATIFFARVVSVSPRPYSSCRNQRRLRASPRVKFRQSPVIGPRACDTSNGEIDGAFQPLRRRAPACRSVRPLPRPQARPASCDARYGARRLRAGSHHRSDCSWASVRSRTCGVSHLRRSHHPPPRLDADLRRAAMAPYRRSRTETNCRRTEDRCSLCLDLERFLEHLPEQLRRCCAWLLADNRRAAAAALGLHRSCLYEAAHDLKRHATEAGLHHYLRTGANPTHPNRTE